MEGRVSQQHFADRLGVHVVTVSSWERGKAQPTIENLTAIAETTGKPLSFFVGGDDDDEDDERALRVIVTMLVEREQDDLAVALLERARLMKAKRETRDVVS